MVDCGSFYRVRHHHRQLIGHGGEDLLGCRLDLAVGKHAVAVIVELEPEQLLFSLARVPRHAAAGR